MNTFSELAKLIAIDVFVTSRHNTNIKRFYTRLPLVGFSKNTEHGSIEVNLTPASVKMEGVD